MQSATSCVLGYVMVVVVDVETKNEVGKCRRRGMLTNAVCGWLYCSLAVVSRFAVKAVSFYVGT